MSDEKHMIYKLIEYQKTRINAIDEEIDGIRGSRNGDSSTGSSQTPTGFTKAMENIARADADTLDKFGLQMYILDVAAKIRHRELCPYTIDGRSPLETEHQQLYRNAIVKGFISDIHSHWNTLDGNSERVSFLCALVFPDRLGEEGDAKTFITGMRATFREETLGDVVEIVIGIQKEKCRLTYKGPLMPYDSIVRYAMGYFLQNVCFMPRSNEAYAAMCNIINYFSQNITRV